MNKSEQQIMKIITTAGESKAKAFEALKMVKTKDFQGARQLLKESREIDIEAHILQTKLITAEINEEEDKPEISLLMVHAQDHYMTSQLARDLIETLIEIFDKGEE